MLYKALDATLKNDQKIKTCIDAKYTNIKVLIILFVFKFYYFPQVLCKWPVHCSLRDLWRIWKWTWKTTQNLKFKYQDYGYSKFGTIFILILSNAYYK